MQSRKREQPFGAVRNGARNQRFDFCRGVGCHRVPARMKLETYSNEPTVLSREHATQEGRFGVLYPRTGLEHSGLFKSQYGLVPKRYVLRGNPKTYVGAHMPPARRFSGVPLTGELWVASACEDGVGQGQNAGFNRVVFNCKGIAVEVPGALLGQFLKLST